MAKEIDCPCGQTVKGEDDDQLIANTTRESSIWNGGMKARDPSPDPAAQSPARR
jgi:hypothetical protein